MNDVSIDQGEVLTKQLNNNSMMTTATTTMTTTTTTTTTITLTKHSKVIKQQ